MNKIRWESWNVKEEEIVSKGPSNVDILEELQDQDEGGAYTIHSAEFLTPFGQYSYDNPFRPALRWDCWFGHTNFDITNDIMQILNKSTGVESLVIMGRYTFCIGIPYIPGEATQVFDSSVVKRDIEEKICGEQLSIDDIRTKIQEYPYWSLLIQPDGNVDFSYSKDNNEEYKISRKTLEDKRETYGGQIFSSESL